MNPASFLLGAAADALLILSVLRGPNDDDGDAPALLVHPICSPGCQACIEAYS